VSARVLGAESLGGAGFDVGGFFFTVLGRGGGFEGAEKTIRDVGYFFDGG
jgi:hypothetical protein